MPNRKYLFLNFELFFCRRDEIEFINGKSASSLSGRSIQSKVWRIPVNETDWSGSFAAHCSKSLILLLDVLKNIPDVNLMVDISAQLRKPPSEENKSLQESDRQEIVIMAATYFNTALQKILDR